MHIFKSKEEKEREKLNQLIYSLNYRSEDLKRKADKSYKEFENNVEQVARLLAEGFDENDAKVKYYTTLSLQNLNSSERMYMSAAAYKTAALKLREIIDTYVGIVDLNTAKNALKNALPILKDVEKKVLDEASTLDQLTEAIRRIIEGPIRTTQEAIVEASPDLTKRVVEIAKLRMRKQKEPEKVDDKEIQEKMNTLIKRMREVMAT